MTEYERRRRDAYHARKVTRLRARGESCWTCRRHALMGSQSVCRSNSLIGDTLTTADALCHAWCAP